MSNNDNELIAITKSDFEEATKKAMSELMDDMKKEDSGGTSAMMIGLSSVICYGKLREILFKAETVTANE